ncbi:MAG: hypothetical protein GWP09_00145 [Nitrospiraceae bacterium]|nr:hypothetical protein [Nitrospiraceae bacterium]
MNKKLLLVTISVIFLIGIVTSVIPKVSAQTNSAGTCKCNWFIIPWVRSNNCNAGYTPQCHFTSCTCKPTNNNIKARPEITNHSIHPIGNITKCVDTDGGLNPYVKGSIILVKGGSRETIFTDQCQNDGTLIEGVCTSNSQWKRESIRCSGVCSDGICLKKTINNTNKTATITLTEDSPKVVKAKKGDTIIISLRNPGDSGYFFNGILYNYNVLRFIKHEHLGIKNNGPYPIEGNFGTDKWTFKVISGGDSILNIYTNNRDNGLMKYFGVEIRAAEISTPKPTPTIPFTPTPYINITHKKCVKEGGLTSGPVNPRYATYCCVGLKAVSPYLKPGVNGSCITPNPKLQPVGSGMLCIKCGDGYCNQAAGENYCNCPEDCKRPAINNNSNNKSQNEMGPECKSLYTVFKKAYQSNCNNSNYNPKCDFNKDGRIVLSDFINFSQHSRDEMWCSEQLRNGINPCKVRPIPPTPTITPIPPTPTPNVCYDSDGGLNYGTYGYVKSGTKYNYDYCASNYLLSEAYCSASGQPERKMFDCSDMNGICSQGKCVILRYTPTPTIPFTPTPTPHKNNSCVTEGGLTSGPVNPQYTTYCCSGLKAVSPYLKPGANGSCVSSRQPVGSGMLCIKCGDGYCNQAAGENYCNCPEDCKSPAINNNSNNESQNKMGPECESLFAVFKKAYQSNCNNSNYNPKCDFNKDGRIVFSDFVNFSQHSRNEMWCSEQLRNGINPCKVRPIPPTPTITPIPPTPTPKGFCKSSTQLLPLSKLLVTHGECTDNQGLHVDHCNGDFAVKYYCGPTAEPNYKQSCYYTSYNCKSYGFNACVNGTCVNTIQNMNNYTCSVDARNCNLNMNKIMYGYLTTDYVWNGYKSVPQIVCKTTGGATWSYDQPGCSIVKELNSTPVAKMCPIKLPIVTTGNDNRCNGMFIGSEYICNSKLDYTPSGKYVCKCNSECMPVNTNINVTPTPTPNSCYDSDGGLNYGTYGYVKLGTEYHYDYCASYYLLSEAYCSASGQPERKIFDCRKINGTCSGGRCVILRYTPIPTPIITVTPTVTPIPTLMMTPVPKPRYY